MHNDAGDKIVYWLMAIACNEALPEAVRKDARDKLFACAMRQPHQSVQDVIGARN